MGFGVAAAGQPSASYVLEARHPDGHRQTLRISAARRVIGSQGDIRVQGIGVEPEHAELIFRDGIVGIRDLGSEGGTWVQGHRTPRKVLRPGRAFRIGGTRFALLAVDGATMPATVDPDEAFEDSPTCLLDVRGGYGARLGQTPLRRTPPPMLDAVVRDVPRPPVPAVPVPPRVPARLPEASPALPAAQVVVAEADPHHQAWLRQAVGAPCWVVSTCTEVLAQLSAHPRLVVVVGHRLLDCHPDQLVDALRRADVAERVSILAVDGVATGCTDLYYRLSPGLSAYDLQKVIASAARPRHGNGMAPVSDTRAWHDKQIFEVCAAVSARPDPASAARALEAGIARLFNVSRAACVFHDASEGALWTESDDNPLEGSAATGIVGFVARTGEPVHVPAVASDPRYHAPIDNPAGTGSEALLAVPILARGEVHAVVVVTRLSVHGFFDQKSCARLAHLARELGPIFGRLSAAMTAQETLQRRQRPQALQLFRPQAVEAYLERRDEGEVLRIAPHWTRAMYWSLLAMLVLGMLGIAVGSIADYSTGPAVIRQQGRAEVAAVGAGAVTSIDVEPGQRVREGQVLARLRDVTERAEFNAIRNDFRAQLRNRLLDPNDNAAATAVRTLKRQLEGAESILEQRVIRAPHDGIVTDINVDAGQQLSIGDAVMAVVDDKVPGLELIAFLPGGDRPLLGAGMPLRLELQGFDYAYQDVIVASVTDGIIGPAEARRVLGPQLADTLPMDGGGVVMVRATLPTTSFDSDGATYPYHDGMGGTAEIRTREETILEMLVPALKEMSK